MFFKLLSKFDYVYLKEIENSYNTNCDKLGKLERKVNDEKVFISKMKNKLCGTRAVIYDIKEDRDGRDTYICVQDLRTPVLNENNCPYMGGDLNIFIMNTGIYSSDRACRYNDMPFLQAKFYETHIHIYELHSSLSNISYENKGYGTMMLETLIDIGRKSGCTSIGGCLSNVDCDTDEKRDNRNRFYENRGFKLSFKDEDFKNGSIHFDINNENA